MLLEVVGDLAAEDRTLHVGGAEMDAGPHSSIDDLLLDIREPLETSRGARFVAEGADSNLVGAEEVLEGLHECTGVGGVSRWVVGEWRCEERWRGCRLVSMGRIVAAMLGRLECSDCSQCRPRGSR